MRGRGPGRPLVPAYLSTEGEARPSRNSLERLSVLTSTAGPEPGGLPPAQQALLGALHGGSLTLMEAAALLRLPVSAVRVLSAALIDQGLATARPPVPSAGRPDHDLLKRVADGLRALKL